MTEYHIAMDTVAMRLLAAAVFAFIMGIDRELKSKPYGIRPYMMLSVGAAALTIMILELAHQSDAIGGNVEIDPGQVIQAIIGSIGFLGAAAIIRGGSNVVGATTGTGIWVAGAVGIACGLGFYWHAVLLTGFAVLIMVILGKLHENIQKRKL